MAQLPNKLSRARSLFVCNDALVSESATAINLFFFENDLVIPKLFPKSVPDKTIANTLLNFFIGNGETVPRSNSYAKYFFELDGMEPFKLRAQSVSDAIIRADHYDQIKRTVDSVLGDGPYGYGQSVKSPKISIGTVVTSAQWRALRADLIAARTHQTGETIGSSAELDGKNLIETSVGILIPALVRHQYTEFSAIVLADRFKVYQNNIFNQPLTTVETNSWRSRFQQTVSITQLNTSQTLSNFFSAGGSVTIQISSPVTQRIGTRPKHSYMFTSRNAALSDTYNSISRFFKSDGEDISMPSLVDWSYVVSPDETITITHSSVKTSSSTVSSGFYSLTSNSQLLFSRTHNGQRFSVYGSHIEETNTMQIYVDFENSRELDINVPLTVTITQQCPVSESVTVTQLSAV